MAKPYSMDLRDRVVDGVAAGQSAQAVAKIFSIGLSTVLRWSRRVQATGSVAPGQMGGHRKPKLLAERDWLLARLREQPDVTLRELLAELAARDVKVSHGALWAFLHKEGLSFKKKRAAGGAGSAGRRPASHALESSSNQDRSRAAGLHR